MANNVDRQALLRLYTDADADAEDMFTRLPLTGSASTRSFMVAVSRAIRPSSHVSVPLLAATRCSERRAKMC